METGVAVTFFGNSFSKPDWLCFQLLKKKFCLNETLIGRLYFYINRHKVELNLLYVSFKATLEKFLNPKLCAPWLLLCTFPGLKLPWNTQGLLQSTTLVPTLFCFMVCCFAWHYFELWEASLWPLQHNNKFMSMAVNVQRFAFMRAVIHPTTVREELKSKRNCQILRAT